MIDVQNLGFSYGSARVLDKISLKLEGGRIYGLLGENGVGKTTLLTLLAGLKKPIEGSILTDGHDPFKREPSLLTNIYYLSEEVSPVREVARDWARMKGKFWPNYSNGKFLEIMKLLETDPDQKMHQMSSGQLKKTYISFALACNARYLLMDEPTNALDIPSKSQFRSAIMKYTSEESTIVISTHQVRDLENIIDPIVILDKADVLLNASLQEISARLFFDYGTQLHQESLYSEQLPGGFIQVYPNVTGEESKVNIEALFNAVHRNKTLVKSMFLK